MSSRRKKKPGHGRNSSDFELVGDIPMYNLEDEAESTLVKVLEARKQEATKNQKVPAESGAGGDAWKPSVVGEKPTIEAVPSLLEPLLAKASSSEGAGKTSPSKKLSLKDVANRVKAMKQQSSSSSSVTGTGTHEETPLSKQSSKLQTILEQMKQTGSARKSSLSEQFSVYRESSNSTEKMMMHGAQAVENLFLGGNEDMNNSAVASEIAAAVAPPQSRQGSRSGELLPLTTNQQTYGTQLPTPVGSSINTNASRKRWRLIPENSAVAELLNCGALMKRLWKFSVVMICVCVPLVVLAMVLFYKLGNPEWDALPDDVPLSWWLLFVARLVVTFEISVQTQYIVVDIMAYRSKYLAKLLGPLITLWIIQSRGWPFLITFWSLYNLILLHGNNTFQKNWLHWTELEIFSDANPGAQILMSELYLRILVSLMLVGFAHTIKSTYMATYLGKRTVLNYKAKLERLLGDLVLVTEVVDLMTALQSYLEAGVNLDEVTDDPGTIAQSTQIKAAKWRSLNLRQSFGGEEGTPPYDEDEEEDVDNNNDDEGDESNDEESDPPKSGSTPSKVPSAEDLRASGIELMGRADLRGSVGASSMDSLRIVKAVLEDWEEPMNKLDQKDSASIGDMLKFRKAMAFMDDEYPFSFAFGPASSRDSCIASARNTYFRLLEVTDSEILSFKVLQLVAINAEGLMNHSKKKRLKRLFRPDRYDEVSVIAFIQACDSLYKRLRFFRASVGNSNVLNRVLENILDAVFNFMLCLTVLALLNFNPWPLLVSLSTLLVSVAFAVGSSASRYIEGILTIAVRRPFDLGDRIMFVGPDDHSNHDMAKFSMLVEDINVYATTLRKGSTNAISTVLNGDIAKYRIVNCARSPNALVYIDVKFQLEVEDEKLAIFRSAVVNFLKERPRTWVELRHFRCQEIHTSGKWVEYQLALLHARPWQDAGRIMLNRAELIKFCYQTGKFLEINYLGVVEQLEVVGDDDNNDDDNNDGGDDLEVVSVGKRVANRQAVGRPKKSASTIAVLPDFFKKKVKADEPE